MVRFAGTSVRVGATSKAIGSDAALMLWVDVIDRSGKLQEHWGCVVRRAVEPAWERLPGSGPEHEWTIEDTELPGRLTQTLSANSSSASTFDLARRLYRQRLGPLEKHLTGVRRLYVVPVNMMASVPIEVLSDQVGLLVLQVVAGGNAAQAGLKPADVLLTYAGTDLTSVGELDQLIAKHVKDEAIAVTVWREGETAERKLRPGELAAVLDRQPARQAIPAKRETDRMLASLSRGGEWQELPGTAIEIQRLQDIAGDEHSTVLSRSAASEQELERLRESSDLAKFRYLHFATHGEPNNAKSFESALILSQDQITGDVPRAGEKYYDGRLTANEVLENWKLNAELVTLSACESALGRPGGGDGLLGFAQAFLLAGARSVCLSLWKVDDTATALLMDRFYQNLLGKREGLPQPMPKAEALAEAKRWLREITFDEAAKLATEMTKGVLRGKNDPALKLIVPTDESAATSKPDDRPFAHPRYWAAFILIGDPD